jgi:hypothetical protein
MVDEGPNLVNPRRPGAQIEGHILRIEEAMKTEANSLLRDNPGPRPFAIGKSANPPPNWPPPPDPDKVSFGSTRHHQPQKPPADFPHCRIVDEADATKGLISFRSPLAQAILGAEVGEVIEAPESFGGR